MHPCKRCGSATEAKTSLCMSCKIQRLIDDVWPFTPKPEGLIGRSNRARWTT